MSNSSDDDYDYDDRSRLRDVVTWNRTAVSGRHGWFAHANFNTDPVFACGAVRKAATGDGPGVLTDANRAECRQHFMRCHVTKRTVVIGYCTKPPRLDAAHRFFCGDGAEENMHAQSLEITAPRRSPSVSIGKRFRAQMRDIITATRPVKLVISADGRMLVAMLEEAAASGVPFEAIDIAYNARLKSQTEADFIKAIRHLVVPSLSLRTFELDPFGMSAYVLPDYPGVTGPLNQVLCIMGESQSLTRANISRSCGTDAACAAQLAMTRASVTITQVGYGYHGDSSDLVKAVEELRLNRAIGYMRIGALLGVPPQLMANTWVSREGWTKWQGVTAATVHARIEAAIAKYARCQASFPACTTGTVAAFTDNPLSCSDVALIVFEYLLDEWAPIKVKAALAAVSEHERGGKRKTATGAAAGVSSKRQRR